MASLQELAELPGSPGFSLLVNRIATAAAIKAVAILHEAAPSADRIAWADAVLRSPHAQGGVLVWALLAENAAATVNQILNASDNAIQTQVNALVDRLLLLL